MSDRQDDASGLLVLLLLPFIVSAYVSLWVWAWELIP